jgi:hypothetical protein
MADRRESADRAISEVLGFMLVFALVVAVVGIISVAGFGTLEDVRDGEQVRNAERAFDVLADNMDDIALRDAPSRTTEIRLRNAQVHIDEPVTLNVTWIDTASGAEENRTFALRPLVYEGRVDAELVYVSGAVFLDQPQGYSIVREPSFRLQSDNTVVPIIRTRSGNLGSVGGSTFRVRTTLPDTPREPIIVDTDGSYDVWFNVTSPRWEIWQQYFQSQPGVSTCLENATTNTVACKMSPDRVAVTVVTVDVYFEQ